MKERLAAKRITLNISAGATEHLAMDGYDPVFGARPLKRLVQHEIVDKVANEIIAGNVHEGDTINIDVDENGNYKASV